MSKLKLPMVVLLILQVLAFLIYPWTTSSAPRRQQCYRQGFCYSSSWGW